MIEDVDSELKEFDLRALAREGTDATKDIELQKTRQGKIEGAEWEEPRAVEGSRSKGDDSSCERASVRRKEESRRKKLNTELETDRVEEPLR